MHRAIEQTFIKIHNANNTIVVNKIDSKCNEVDADTSKCEIINTQI